MEDPETGAHASEAGASADLGQPSTGASRASKGFSPGANPRDGGSARSDAPPDQSKGKKRRKRKRGRKVFARDGAAAIPAAGARNGTPGSTGLALVQQAKDERVTPGVTGGNGARPLTNAGQVAAMPTGAEAARRQVEAEMARPFAQRRHDLPVFAALDLGTNNCRLLVAVPTRPGQFRVIDAFSRIVRLGEGLTASGRLSGPAMDRAVEALKICGDKLRNRAIRKSRLIATEACRSAENGAEFLDRVSSETGLTLEIIDRRTEARLAVSGCGSLVERDTQGVVLFDIGGGSSEIALIDVSGQRSPRLANHIVAWTSLPVGVVSLAERFGGRDVTRETFAAMVANVTEMLEDFHGRDRVDHLMAGGRFHLLGTSGTVTTLAGVQLGLERYDRRRVDGLWMDRAGVDEMIDKLIGWNFQERVANACIGAERADLVLAGCAILEAIRRVWPSERLRVADRGLREGILSELMGDDGVWRRDWRGGRA